MTGRRLFVWWVAFVIVTYALALLFIVPPTGEARAVASVLFGWAGLITAVYGGILWRNR